MWSRWPTSGLRSGSTTGIWRQLAALDAMVMWLILSGWLVASLRAIVRPAPLRLALLVYVGLAGLSVAIAVANVGTPYRLSLQVLFPAVLPATEGWAFLRARALARQMRAVAPRLEPSM
jgi:hypothetical protein